MLRLHPYPRGQNGPVSSVIAGHVHGITDGSSQARATVDRGAADEHTMLTVGSREDKAIGRERRYGTVQTHESAVNQDFASQNHSLPTVVALEGHVVAGDQIRQRE